MKISMTSFVMIGCSLVMLGLSVLMGWSGSGSGSGWSVGIDSQVMADQPQMASNLITSLPVATESFKYIGSSKCKMCHIKQYKSWKKTKMGQAFKILLPGNSVEAKLKFNIESQEDFTQEAACIVCHTTGFGQPGGYAIPDPSDKKAVKHAKKMRNVGCESCHGPGSAYVKIHKEILMTKRKYKVEEMYAAGMTKIEAGACTTCHNEQSPTIDSNTPFDFHKKKDEGTHDHFKLKYRIGS